jgi:Membrane iron-sulfur containing protein FtrD-like
MGCTQQSKLRSPQLRLFETSASGQKVKFIVQRTPDQIVHVAVASCRACYRNRDSHYALNGEMICGQCKEAMDFESKVQKARTNHCALVEVPHTESGGDVAVLVRDVFAQAAMLPQ